MKLHATNWRCDACGHVDRYNNPTMPKGWVQANIAEVDETKRGGLLTCTCARVVPPKPWTHGYRSTPGGAARNAGRW